MENDIENKNGIYKRNGGIQYYKDNKLHRLDGPAVIFESGLRWWFKEGKFHRTNGPAIYNTRERSTRIWFQEGKRHNTYGPAVEYTNGNYKYYIRGVWIDGIEEFERIKIREFLKL